MLIEFSVHGTPQPQGSTRAFVPRGWRTAVITTDNKALKPWRQEVSGMAQRAMQKAGVTIIADGPVFVQVDFQFARPKSVKAEQKTTRPDCDKLARGVLDALSGIAFKDDAQVVHLAVWKRYGLPEGAHITVRSA